VWHTDTLARRERVLVWPHQQQVSEQARTLFAPDHASHDAQIN
jgi:hypothetical protein